MKGRALLDNDLDRCAWHPDRPSVGWRDRRDEAGALSAVGVCVECAADLGSVNLPVGTGVVLNADKPCLCGPGFCASRAGVGYYGFCAGSRPVGGPDCPGCGAPHQSDAGCWLCTRVGPPEPWEADNNRMWLRALALGVTTTEMFDRQDAAQRRGEWLTMDQIMDRIVVERGDS